MRMSEWETWQEHSCDFHPCPHSKEILAFHLAETGKKKKAVLWGSPKEGNGGGGVTRGGREERRERECA